MGRADEAVGEGVRDAWAAWGNVTEETSGRGVGTRQGHPTERCPCCSHRTLAARGRFEICPVCSWEDDGQDDADADDVRGGPNGYLSLTLARTNYRMFGASDDRHAAFVRPPRPHEV
jgi:Cysteine-rich CPCC